MSATATTTVRQSGVGSPIGWLFLGVLAVGIGAMVICDRTYGAPMRATLESNRAADIAQENRAFCTKLGFASGTSMLTNCAAALDGYRQQAEERLIKEVGSY